MVYGYCSPVAVRLYTSVHAKKPTNTYSNGCLLVCYALLTLTQRFIHQCSCNTPAEGAESCVSLTKAQYDSAGKLFYARFLMANAMK